MSNFCLCFGVLVGSTQNRLPCGITGPLLSVYLSLHKMLWLFVSITSHPVLCFHFILFQTFLINICTNLNVKLINNLHTIYVYNSSIHFLNSTITISVQSIGTYALYIAHCFTCIEYSLFVLNMFCISLILYNFCLFLYLLIVL